MLAEGQQRAAGIEIGRLYGRLPVAVDNAARRGLVPFGESDLELALSDLRRCEVQYHHPFAEWRRPRERVAAHHSSCPAEGSNDRARVAPRHPHLSGGG